MSSDTTNSVRALIDEWHMTAAHMRRENKDDRLPHADPYDQCADDLEAALAQQPAIPEGVVMVPMEPTDMTPPSAM